jgi:hypothetical protein
MSVNIVQLITTQLGGGTLNKLSSAIGETPDRTQGAVNAAVPTLLAGFTHVASTPEGAQRLTKAINQQSPDTDTNFASSLDSNTGKQEASSNLLGNLMGGGVASGLTSALGQFTGMKTGAVSHLLGAIGPLALTVIGKQQKSMGQDASGLSGFLNSQKQNITSAMPSGLSTMLSGIPGFSGFTQKLPSEPELTHAGASPSLSGTSAGAGQFVPETHAASPIRRETASPLRWLIPLLIIAALAWAFYAWNQRRNATPTTEPTTATEPAAPSRSAPR